MSMVYFTIYQIYLYLYIYLLSIYLFIDEDYRQGETLKSHDDFLKINNS